MRLCPRCNNVAQDADRACGHCGMVLDPSVIPGPTRVRTPTVAEGPQRPMPTPPPPKIEYRPTPPSSRPVSGQSILPTQPSSTPSAPPSGAGRRGQTVYLPPSSEEQPLSQSTPLPLSRRVIAVLVTYSWKPDGQVFPVREGRNLIGRGEECDIRIADDPMLSLVNSHITYRTTFTVGDMVSMSGTDVNGETIEQQFLPLANLARIRAGSTQFVFIIVDPELMQAGG